MVKQRSYRDLPRCPVPVIFLDTYVICNIAKWKSGKELDKITLDRAKTLYETIHQLVRAKKIICPEIATWQDEYRLDSRIDEMCENVVVDLSQGITFTRPQGMEDSQVQLAMKAYVEQAGSVDYSKEWLLMYTRDPIEELKNKRPFVVRFNWAKNVETNEQIRERNV